jgi:hypothetical protein
MRCTSVAGSSTNAGDLLESFAKGLRKGPSDSRFEVNRQDANRAVLTGSFPGAANEKWNALILAVVDGNEAWLVVTLGNWAPPGAKADAERIVGSFFLAPRK